MEESKRNEWDIMAKQCSSLRYPLFNLTINSSNTNGRIIFGTFVRDKSSNLICLVEDRFEFRQPFIWENLESLKKRFLEKCKLHQDNYIYNKDTAIKEPYDI